MRALTLFLALAGALFAAGSDADTGRNGYLLECQGCHGADGGGANPSVPSLKGRMAGFLLVEGGREFLVQVPGSAQSTLADAELADTLNWMLAEFGPRDVAASQPPYTAREVARLRSEPEAEPAARRRALAARLAPLFPEPQR